MLRVLHCIYDDRENPWVGGGGAHRVAELYSCLVGRVDVTVASGNFPGARREVVSEGVRYLRIGAAAPYALSRLSYAVEASRRMAREDYDVALYDYSVYTPLRIPKRRPVGVIVHMLMKRAVELRWGPMIAPALCRLERDLLARSRFVCATSSGAARELRGVLSPEAEVWTVGNGVRDDVWQVTREDRGYLLYIGRFDVLQKGLDTLLAAVAELVRVRPSLQLRMAGRGKDSSRLCAMARNMGLGENVTVQEGVTRAEMLALFSGAAALVMPSRFEGLPIVPMEAMAIGVPVVATSVGELPSIVSVPRTGLLVPPDDPRALASAVQELLDDPQRRARMGREARLVGRRFSWPSLAEEHLRFLEHVAGCSTADVIGGGTM